MANFKLHCKLMSKKTNINSRSNSPQTIGSTTLATPKPSFKWSLFDFRSQAIFIALISFIFYFNTLQHEYAFDDMMAIVNNEYVQQGVSGIPDIMSKDAFQSYLEQRNGGNQLSGGRYRPLSLISFAIEQQILGIDADEQTYNGVTGGGRSKTSEDKMIADMHFRHFINVLLYILASIILLQLMHKVIFPNQPILSFLTVILFTIHPLHTEVVANVKSRDELLSIIFIALTFLKAYSYYNFKVMKDLIWGCFYFFLALLSKEYAITLLIMIPLFIYIFNKASWSKCIQLLLPFLLPFALYMLLRMGATGSAAEGADKDIMNYPYLYATAIEKLATEFWVLLKYLQLLICPYPMCADYSFNQIKYVNFSNIQAIASVIIYILISIGMVIGILKRHVLGFAAAFFLINLVLIANFFVNIGAPMGERLVFHSSLGFCIGLAYILFHLFQKYTAGNGHYFALKGLMLVLIILCAGVTMSRNKDWKNNNTLFIADVQTSPNSALTNSNAGAAYMAFAKEAGPGAVANQYFDQAIQYFTKSITINPKHHLALINRGLCYYNSRKPELAVQDWAAARKLSPGAANLNKYLNICEQYFYNKGNQYTQEKKVDSAIAAFQYGVLAAPQAGQMWYNLALTLAAAGKKDAAMEAIRKADALMPNDPQVKQATQLIINTLQ